MIKADKYYRENLTQILEEKNKDDDPRPKYKDGMSAHSYFITQVSEKYDIEKGEFPITTLRNTATKTGIKEILTIYQEQSNTKEGFHQNGVFWWDDWMNEDDNIGRSYSYNLESHRPNEMSRLVVKVEPVIIDMKYSKLLDIKVMDMEESIDGKIYMSKYIILNKDVREDNYGRKYHKIQYLDSGYITEMRSDYIGNSLGSNPYERIYYGIGYLGEYDRVKNIKNINIFLNIWEGILKECSESEECFVHQEWHSFENFLRDVRMLPQYHLAKEDNFVNWKIDRNYYGSNCYSLNTCVFLSDIDNDTYVNYRPLKVTSRDVNEYVLDLSIFCDTKGLNYSNVIDVLDGNIKRHRGFKFEYLYDDNALYRYELSRNQMNYLLNGLKNDPYSRRHIISFWNWSNIDKKELVECAFETLWSVRKKDGNMYLDLTLNQRSNDYIMAGYINKIQYVALQMMVACHLGYKVGRFKHDVQNLHIYDRHIEACVELLNRTDLYDQPYITLDVPNKTNFYDMRLEDFKVYVPKSIKKIESSLEIAV